MVELQWRVARGDMRPPIFRRRLIQHHLPMPRCASHRQISRYIWFVLGCSILALTCRGQDIVFHLRNGDRITGAVVSENDVEVTVATAFAGKITLPLAQIDKREKMPATAVPAATNVPPSIAASKTGTNTTVTSKPADTNKASVATAPSKAAWRCFRLSR